MPTLQTLSAGHDGPANPVAVRGESGAPLRWAVLVGVWGLVSGGAPPARIGEDVEVPGGFMRVDGIADEHMAPMQSQKFAASMSSMGMDMAPEGKRLFTVEVTLTGGGSESDGHH